MIFSSEYLNNNKGVLNKFSTNLLTDIYDSENIVISPLSIATAFAHLSYGAEYNTQKEIYEALGFSNNQDLDKYFFNVLWLR